MIPFLLLSIQAVSDVSNPGGRPERPQGLPRGAGAGAEAGRTGTGADSAGSAGYATGTGCVSHAGYGGSATGDVRTRCADRTGHANRTDTNRWFSRDGLNHKFAGNA